MRRRWRMRQPDEPTIERLRQAAGISPLLARLLVARGVTDPAAAAGFLGAKLADNLRSPMLFREMPRATDRVLTALRTGEQIGIYGDYDVDGISGSSVLLRFFRDLGVEPLLHIPNRLRDGYGVSEPGVRKLAESGAKLMITVDCGGVSHREIALAASLGMQTIVCDHHQVSGSPLPAAGVLNPIEADAGFPFSGLCGAGVAFYLALGVRMRLREEVGAKVPDLKRSLDLVALGTIADLVPVVEENRVLVKHGMREIETSTLPGLRALKHVSGVTDVSSGSIGFRLAPRLNAGGRLADATRSVELLTTDDPARAGELAAYLDEENKSRQVIEREIFDEAVRMVETAGGIESKKSIVLGSDDWHPGVIGIVASRMVERYYRPTILIATGSENGIGRGSGRSIRGHNLYESIRRAREHLEGFGGHKMAAGLSIRPDRVADFAMAFEAAVDGRTTPDDFVPETDVDAELRLAELDEECIAALAQLEPFGISNPEPIFVARRVTVRNSRIVGTSHLKLYLQQESRTMPGIGFGMADQTVRPGDVIDLLFSPLVNEWNGTRSIELRIRDLRPSQA